MTLQLCWGRSICAPSSALIQSGATVISFTHRTFCSSSLITQSHGDKAMHLKDRADSSCLGQVNITTHLFYILHCSSMHFQPQFKEMVTKAFVTEDRENTEKDFCFLKALFEQKAEPIFSMVCLGIQVLLWALLFSPTVLGTTPSVLVEIEKVMETSSVRQPALTAERQLWLTNSQL